MNSGLFLGVDAGQSSTLAVICDRQGRLLGSGKAGPSNHVHEPGGPQRLEKALRCSILTAWKNASVHTGKTADDLLEFEAGFLGMTGGVELVPDVLSRFVKFHQLSVDFDMVTAHAGALAGAPGVVVIAGTGSIAYGVNLAGQSARAGGWAYLMGDEGSGYDIGRKSLIAAARDEDGRGPSTCLKEDILAYFGKSDLWDVRRMIYTNEIDRSKIAGLARLVSDAARRGDPVALHIFEEAGRELAEIAVAVLHRLKMDKEPAAVSTAGGVFQAGDLILSPFTLAVHAKIPQARILSPIFTPAVGALILALKMAGIDIDQRLMQELKRTNQMLGEKK